MTSDIFSVLRPAFEIVILWVAIYYTFNFMRGTRGAPVVTGFVILLLGVTLVTVALKLMVLRWLLGALFSVIAVAVLVIFQPEMRKLLARLGSHSVFQVQHQQRENIEIIIDSAEALAEARIGALMALERSIQLPEVVEVGITVDCVATPEMLETIFFPNNAVHDGGVIIKGARITHAACIFPLTQQGIANKSMGTRHRAAIGLSEETDAAVVVVSEERGVISYAYKGILTQDVTPEELRSFLTAVMVSKSRQRTWLDSLRNWAHRNLPALMPDAPK